MKKESYLMLKEEWMEAANNYPAKVYETQVKRNMPADLPARVLALIVERKGKRNFISRVELVNRIFNLNLPPQANLDNLREDRQIRLAIAQLRGKYPIMSSSGNGGYFYAESREEIEKFCRELESRAVQLHENVRHLRNVALAEFGQARLIP
jgi:hypothetical protein